MVRRQLTEAAKGRALGLIEDAGWSINDVATSLRVSRWTIMRLSARRKEEPDCEVPRRKQGTGPRRKYGKRELDAIEKALDKNTFLTSRDLKLKMPKTLKDIDGRMVRRIVRDDLDRPARVAPVKACLNGTMQSARVEWVNSKLRRKSSEWQGALYIDEVLFEASGGGVGWRLVRRPRGAPRHDPQYCRRRFKRPRKIMALAGIASDGSRFLEFLRLNEMMNSELYCNLLKKKALKIVKERNLKILHDRSKIHTSRKTETFLNTEKVKTILLPGKSYDLNPIENCFGLLEKKLEKEPSRSLEEAKSKERKLWTGMNNDYLFKLCTSMKRRMKLVKETEGNLTKY